jgi:hypothetical protein
MLGLLRWNPGHVIPFQGSSDIGATIQTLTRIPLRRDDSPAEIDELIAASGLLCVRTGGGPVDSTAEIGEDEGQDEADPALD